MEFLNGLVWFLNGVSEWTFTLKTVAEIDKYPGVATGCPTDMDNVNPITNNVDKMFTRLYDGKSDKAKASPSSVDVP